MRVSLTARSLARTEPCCQSRATAWSQDKGLFDVLRRVQYASPSCPFKDPALSAKDCSRGICKGDAEAGHGRDGLAPGGACSV